VAPIFDQRERAATLHRELGQLARGKTRWDAKTVVMVDEAAMIDNAIMAKLLRATEQSGANPFHNVRVHHAE
jgi:hypothetical protein